MKGYLATSTAAHLALLLGLYTAGTLLTRPRMSYYAVDLFNASPAGSAEVSSPGVITGPAARPVAKAVEAPPAVRERPAPNEAIRIPDKHKRSKPAAAKPKPAVPVRPPVSKYIPGLTLPEDESTGGGGGGGSGMTAGGGSGSGVVADAGPAFPYPWYLKLVTDKLDKQWHVPPEYPSGFVCVVQFTISRSGQISNVNFEKHSGDSFYDEIGRRAVLNANPMPPLPNGFPDETLQVHMKFIKKAP